MNDAATFKFTCYIIMVVCFFCAGICELFEGHYRMGVVSGLLGVVQALIFLVGRG